MWIGPKMASLYWDFFREENLLIADTEAFLFCACTPDGSWNRDAQGKFSRGGPCAENGRRRYSVWKPRCEDSGYVKRVGASDDEPSNSGRP